MKKPLLTFSLILLTLFSFGQDIHSPAEIFLIMEKSPVTYELNLLENIIPPPDRTDNLNYNQYYREIDENGITTYGYEINEIASNYLSKAENYYSEGKFNLAREMYLKVLDSDSSYYEVMTYIGQMYENEGNFDKAIEWYEKTITHNYIDYMAHWFLADAYRRQGNIDKAVNEITIAMILNRNNPRIKVSYLNIYKQKKLKTSDWVFNPQVELDSIGTDEFRVSFGEDWLGYAMVKALWKYEPGYSESMGVSKGSYSTIQEKEGIASLLSVLSKKKLKKVPEFKAMKLALDNEMVDEFILYEIVLLNIPFVAYQLPENVISDIKDYVIQVRGKEK